MQYRLHKTLTGKLRVKYSCTHCGEALESELAEAGKQDKCPTCQREYIVPGEEKRKQVEIELKKQAEAKKLAEAERLASEQKAKADKEVAQSEAQQRKQAQEEQEVRESTERASAYQIEKRAQVIASIPVNVSYPAIETYNWILNACGKAWLIGGIGFALAYASNVLVAIAKEESNFWLTSLGSYVAVVGVISTLTLALAFLVSSQLLQLALDARRDLAKLVSKNRDNA